jgi:hypothetical protein
MKRADFVSIGLAVYISCIGIYFIVDTMQKNDRMADCEMRGGLMKKIDGERQCVIERVRYAGE